MEKEQLVDEIRKLKHRSDTERLVEDVATLKNRSDAKKLTEAIEKIKDRPDSKHLIERIGELKIWKSYMKWGGAASNSDSKSNSDEEDCENEPKINEADGPYKRRL